MKKCTMLFIALVIPVMLFAGTYTFSKNSKHVYVATDAQGMYMAGISFQSWYASGIGGSFAYDQYSETNNNNQYDYSIITVSVQYMKKWVGIGNLVYLTTDSGLFFQISKVETTDGFTIDGTDYGIINDATLEVNVNSPFSFPDSIGVYAGLRTHLYVSTSDIHDSFSTESVAIFGVKYHF